MTVHTVHNPAPERPGARRRRNRRRALTAALALALAGGGTACGSDEPSRYSRTCGVVVDGSGSAAASRTGFDAEAKLKATLQRFLADKKCRKTSFAPITKVSEASKCQVSPLDLDPNTSKTADRERTRTTMRAVALSNALKLLRCAQKEEPGSDVLGGLSRIGLSKPSGADASFDVLVVSDFDQGDTDFRLGRQDLSTAASRRTVIDDFLKSHGRPELSGADIYPVGYGMKYGTDTSRYEQFNSFWTELLEGRVKAHVHTTYRR